MFGNFSKNVWEIFRKMFRKFFEKCLENFSKNVWEIFRECFRNFCLLGSAGLESPVVKGDLSPVVRGRIPGGGRSNPWWWGVESPVVAIGQICTTYRSFYVV